jgi:hypothetical protein
VSAQIRIIFPHELTEFITHGSLALWLQTNVNVLRRPSTSTLASSHAYILSLFCKSCFHLITCNFQKWQCFTRAVLSKWLDEQAVLRVSKIKLHGQRWLWTSTLKILSFHALDSARTTVLHSLHAYELHNATRLHGTVASDGSSAHRILH